MATWMVRMPLSLCTSTSLTKAPFEHLINEFRGKGGGVFVENGHLHLDGSDAALDLH